MPTQTTQPSNGRLVVRLIPGCKILPVAVGLLLLLLLLLLRCFSYCVCKKRTFAIRSKACNINPSLRTPQSCTPPVPCCSASPRLLCQRHTTFWPQLHFTFVPTVGWRVHLGCTDKMPTPLLPQLVNVWRSGFAQSTSLPPQEQAVLTTIYLEVMRYFEAMCTG